MEHCPVGARGEALLKRRMLEQAACSDLAACDDRAPAMKLDAHPLGYDTARYVHCMDGYSRHQFSFAPESLTGWYHSFTCAATKAVNCSGVMSRLCTPSSARRCATFGSASAFLFAALIRATTSRGRPAGPEMPRKFSARSFFWPRSCTRGTSGAIGARAGEVTAMARSFPSLMNGTFCGSVSMASLIVPDRRSLCMGEEPL